MLDPNTGIVFASTIPRQGRRNEMTAAARSPQYPRAQAWWNSKTPYQRRLIHAEDGAYFNWETMNRAVLNSGQYPAGSMVLVWGYQPGIPVSEQKLCSGCRTVAENLGVAFKELPLINGQLVTMRWPQIAAPPPAGVPISAPPTPLQPDPSAGDAVEGSVFEDEDADGLTCSDEQGNTIGKRLAKRGNGGALIPLPVRRQANATATACSLVDSEFGSTFSLPSEALNPVTGSLSQATTIQISSSEVAATSPAPSCSMQEADPDSGRNKANCVCDESITLPLISAPVTAVATMSCAYTALPTGSATAEIITTKPTLGPATTISQSCQVCTPVENNADSCTSISGCLIKTAQATVTAGSTPIPVGTLTGDALYTTISNALESLCPSATSGIMTSCTPTAEVTLKNIAYVADGGLNTDGEIIVAVESSSYNVTSLRDALIQSIATSTQYGATGNNCYIAEYKVDITQAKRSIDLRDYWPISRIFKRQETGVPSDYESRNVTLCNTNWFQNGNYYNPYWHIDGDTSPSAWLSADYKFEIVLPGGNFVCDLADALLDAFALIQPEFAVGDVELEGLIDFACGDKESG